MTNALQDRPVSLYSFSFSLSSPTPGDRKEFLNSFDEAAARHRHSRHRHHKKSKGHKAKRRDRFSLSLEPSDEDKSSSLGLVRHPAGRATRSRVQSMNLSTTLNSSSPSPVDEEETDTEASLSLKGLGLSTSAGVTDLDGFVWGGGGRQGNTVDCRSSNSASAASVGATSPSGALSQHPQTVPSYGSKSSADVGSPRVAFVRTNSESDATIEKTVATGPTTVLRRRVSLPEDDLARRRSCGAALQFVQEIGLVQIKEEGRRGLRPRSAVLLSDSDREMSAAVQAALSSESGQKALFNRAMKRRSTELYDRGKSGSFMTLHTLSETDPIQSFTVNGTPTGKGQQIHMLQYYNNSAQRTHACIIMQILHSRGVQHRILGMGVLLLSTIAIYLCLAHCQLYSCAY